MAVARHQPRMRLGRAAAVALVVALGLATFWLL